MSLRKKDAELEIIDLGVFNFLSPLPNQTFPRCENAMQHQIRTLRYTVHLAQSRTFCPPRNIPWPLHLHDFSLALFSNWTFVKTEIFRIENYGETRAGSKLHRISFPFHSKEIQKYGKRTVLFLSSCVGLCLNGFAFFCTYQPTLHTYAYLQYSTGSTGCYR